MASVIVDDTNLKNIANAIRDKNGENTTYKPSEMATAIEDIDTQDSTAVIEFVERTLTEFYNDKITKVGDFALYGCSMLTSIDLPEATSIGIRTFQACSNLITFILRSPIVATLANASSFNSTPIETGTGYIYVPSDLVDSYKSATNWSTYAEQIRAIEDYPEITGG